MATVWTFGDSNTAGFKSSDLWARKYVDWKGYTPKTYGEIIAEKLDLDLVNLGRGGFDNYTIFETFCEVIGRIKKDDIIIFGWSCPLRWRLVTDIGKWKSILPKSNKHDGSFNHISTNTIDEILVNRDHFLYSIEVNNWINLINLAFKDNIVKHWTSFESEIDAIFISGIERICIETNYEITDGHFSEKGQLELSEKLMSTFIKNKKFI
jgi:hypothetical protein